MATPMSPGWYPAPDGNGEQWWNGAGWSEGRRNADGTTPGLPGYQAAPPAVPAVPVVPAGPAPISAPNPYGQPVAAGTTGGLRVGNSPALVALVFSGLSLFVFAPLGIVGIVLGVIALRKAEATGAARGMSIGAIVLGGVGIVLGIIQLVIWIAALAPVIVEFS